jgi:outer membrane immunogenic protein
MVGTRRNESPARGRRFFDRATGGGDGMRKLLGPCAVLFAFAAINAASAQPAFNWSGCYIGVNGGYGWNNGSTSYQGDPNTLLGDPINFVPDFLGNPLTYLPAPSATGGSGGIGGGTAGCNWQRQRWVFGIEGDFDGAHIRGSNTTTASTDGFSKFSIGPGTYTGVVASVVANEQVSLQWLSTVRARAGIAVQEHLLLYATGGFAVGSVNSQGSVALSATLNSGGLESVWGGSNSTVLTGGVVGGGAEWAFYDSWTFKAEYLWYDLGRVNHPLNCTFERTPSGSACTTNVFATLGNASSSVFGSIARVGINYKFY